MMLDWTLLAPDEDSRDLASAAGALLGSLPGVGAARVALDQDGIGGEDADPPPGWSALVDGGYLDIAVPEALGGLGRLIDLVVVLEEAGRSLLTAPLLPTVLAVQTQVAAGIHRPAGRTDPAGFALAPGTVADGRCVADRVPVLGGVGATTLTAVLRASDRAWVVTLDPTAQGVEILQNKTLIDPSRPVTVIRLAGVPCTDSRSLAPSEAEAVLARARVCLAADLVGIAAGALAAALEHARQRQQFGAPIGSFQAIKHQLADAYVAVERARSLTYGAAVAQPTDPAADTGGATAGGTPDPSTRDSLLAYAAAAEAALQVAGRYVQILGAMGVTFEADAHLYLRRAHQLASLFGAPDDLFLAAARIERARAERAGTERARADRASTEREAGIAREARR